MMVKSTIDLLHLVESVFFLLRRQNATIVSHVTKICFCSFFMKYNDLKQEVTR